MPAKVVAVATKNTPTTNATEHSITVPTTRNAPGESGAALTLTTSHVLVAVLGNREGPGADTRTATAVTPGWTGVRNTEAWNPNYGSVVGFFTRQAVAGGQGATHTFGFTGASRGGVVLQLLVIEGLESATVVGSNTRLGFAGATNGALRALDLTTDLTETFFVFAAGGAAGASAVTVANPGAWDFLSTMQNASATMNYYVSVAADQRTGGYVETADGFVYTPSAGDGSNYVATLAAFKPAGATTGPAARVDVEIAATLNGAALAESSFVPGATWQHAVVVPETIADGSEFYLRLTPYRADGTVGAVVTHRLVLIGGADAGPTTAVTEPAAGSTVERTFEVRGTYAA